MLLKASSRSVSITINFFADYLKSFLPGCQFGFGHLVKNGTNLPKANGSTATNRWSRLDIKKYSNPVAFSITRVSF